ncbi:MAG: hypothetical protein WCB50_06615 [Pseudolabrys sp.]|jgi:hypothetical protein
MMRLVATSLLLAIVLMSSAKLEASGGIEQAFDGAINAINEERAKNRANEFGCTQFFSDFYRVKKIEPYVVFLKGRGVQAVIADANQQHFVSFAIPSTQLRTWGYRNFYRGDTLVLVFTTASSKPDDITSFSARLFGRTYP